MTNNPFDFEAERNRMAKELGLTYSDNGKAVFWQENMQAQEAKRDLTEILANERKPNRTSAFEETPNSAQEPVPESSAAGSDFDQTRSCQEADAPCDAIYSQGRTTESQSEQTAGVSMAKEHSKLSLKLRMKSMFNRFQGFAQSRKERSQASGVAAQQKEKKKQVQTAVAGLTVVFVLVTGAMIVAGDERRARPEPVRVYKSDFRLEPDALDKQSYQKQYDEKLAGMTERLQTIEELAMRLQKELDAKEGKRTAGKSDAASAALVPVTELPPFSAQGANREAQSLGTAMNAGAAAVVPIDSPRLKRLAVTDPVKDFEAIRTAARERFTPKRANAGDTPIAANRARNEAAGTYLPAGSFARAVVLAGATVSTGGTASSNPVPMLLEIKDLARLPNAFRANVKACFVTANGRPLERTRLDSSGASELHDPKRQGSGCTHPGLCDGRRRQDGRQSAPCDPKRSGDCKCASHRFHLGSGKGGLAVGSGHHDLYVGSGRNDRERQFPRRFGRGARKCARSHRRLLHPLGRQDIPVSGNRLGPQGRSDSLAGADGGRG